MGTAAALAIGGGIGGGAGSILTAGIAGGPIGALLAGGTAAIGAGISFASEGVDAAKGRNGDLDTLKRSMGDLGVSFQQLNADAFKFGEGLGVANTEFVKIENGLMGASGGLYRTPDEVGSAARTSVGLSNAYGVDKGAMAAFVGGMGRLNNHQNNKELAAQLAEAINNAQGKAMPVEVMQAMQTFVSQQSRFNAGSVDLDRFGNAYSSLLDKDGMTADHASSIIGQANASMQQMGGSEAAENFTMRAYGNLDPIRARIRSEGGLFNNGLDDRDISAYMRHRGMSDWDSMSKGPAGTNLSLINSQFDSAYKGNPELELDAQKNYWQLKSLGDTAKFVNMSDSAHNGVMTSLKDAGVDLKDIREGGIQAIAGISGASDFDSLDKLYKGSIRGRPDMSTADTNMLDKAEKSGDFTTFKNELVRVLAGKGQEDTAATIQSRIDSNIADMKTSIGSKLIPYTQGIMQGVLAMANKVPGVHIADPTFVGPPKSAKLVPGANPRVDQSDVAAPALNSIANKVDAGNAWADNMAGKANLAYGAGVGKAYSYRDSVTGGMSQLAGLGIDSAHAAAIMASAIRESSMNPDVTDKKGMYGLFQFDAARQADFKKVMGKDIHGSTQQEQIAYMVKSMQSGGEEAGPGKAFLSASGPDLAGVFARKVERPADPSKESDIRNGIASQLYDDDKPSQISDKDRARAAAASQSSSPAGVGAGAGALYGPSGNLTINFEQHNTTPSGKKAMHKMSTTVPLPSSSGTEPKFYVPGSN
ncbi:hypothetical protein GNZ12_24245 [Paraburkholderia sp. 1N]|uniref:Phage tail lysozyme domain-containing protein n=2 Tax=Paraburkholderia solitsugae TaxID=2675748 RepID=A0ABX2BWQ7_9BURK|nr:hypothetical protein [Paraburkholderia solitsugae]